MMNRDQITPPPPPPTHHRCAQVHTGQAAVGKLAQLAALGVGFPVGASVGEPRAVLSMSPDPVKDQTYFLCNLKQVR